MGYVARRGKLYDKKKKVAATCGRRMFGLGERRQGEADVFFEFPSRARQEVFVFFLHLFTGRSQRAVYQSVRGEGFEENTFTCSVADFAVGEAGRVAREIRGKCWKKWDFSVVGWGESREGR